MQFQSLSIAGFRSFRQPQTVRLDGAPGLVYVTGDNQAEPELGANGVGKSTLFEALHWVLYGKTSRNLRASDVANWMDAVDCRVEVSLDGRSIVRTWHPNTLTVDGEEVSQSRLNEIIGLGEDAFLHTIYHAQFISHFSDLGPTAQLELFSDVLRLQVWEAAADQANAIAKKHSGELAAVRERAAGVLGEWRQVVHELETLEVKEAYWWYKHIAAQRERWEALKAAKLAYARPAVNDIPVPDKALEKKLHAARESMAERRGNIKAHQQVLDRLEGLDGEVECPMCFQPIDTKTVMKHRKELRAKLTHLAAEQTAAAAQAENLQKAWNKASQVREQRRAELQEQDARARAAWKVAEERCAAGAAEECPYDTEPLRARLAELEERLSAVRKVEGTAEWAIQAHEFWVKAFREIRLSIVEQALLQFESATNNALAALGLLDWSIEYDVQSETKGGKLSKGFVIYVHSPHNDGPVPFAAWSGGESQRLRLAVSLGLSDLIQDFCGVHSDMEIFDEPTNWLSGEGLEHLLQVLAERARERKIRIYLADHKALEYAFDSVVTVTKDSGGSRVEAT